MANRCTLHISKMDDFKEYLTSKDIAYRPGKGTYQVMQVLTPRHGWQCIYERNNMPEHFTVQDKLMPIVFKFLEQSRLEQVAIEEDADREMFGNDAFFLDSPGHK